MRVIRIGVIGCGQWGPNHIRNLSHHQQSLVLSCSDLSEKRLQMMRQAFPNIHTTRDASEILNDPNIDAVVIATPTNTHYELVKNALLAGKDVLCEKPLCLKGSQAKELSRIATRKKRILMIGHVFLFNPGIRHLKQMIQKRSCGQLYYMHSERTNLGPFRRDVNSVWDLASHDVSIFNYLLEALPTEVSARGATYLQKKIEDVAFISLVYPKGVLVNIHVSWLDPKKVRQITVVGDKKMVIWDDMDSIGPVKIYDKKVVRKEYYDTFGEFYLLAKEGRITIPKLDLYEPLKEQASHFLMCCRLRKSPLTDGKEAEGVVHVLEKIQESLAKRGAPVRISK